MKRVVCVLLTLLMPALTGGLAMSVSARAEGGDIGRFGRAE